MTSPSAAAANAGSKGSAILPQPLLTLAKFPDTWIGTTWAISRRASNPGSLQLPAALLGQAAAFIRVAVMRGQRTPRIGKLGEHGFPSLDKSRPDIGADDIDAERKEPVPLGGDEPPPPFPPLC